MQTKKKVLARNASKEHANPRLSRQQKKVTMLAERKATELITSSAKKKKNGRILSSKYRDEAVENLNASCLSSQDETRGICMAYESPIDHKPDDRATQCVLETIFSPAFHLPKDACGGFADKVDFMNFFRSRDQPDCQDHGVEKSKLDILSYHSMQENQQNTIENRIVDTSTCTCNNNTNMMAKSTESSDGQSNHSHAPPIESNDANTIFDEEYRGLGNLSSEVSAIYLAMQHSKLECIDEPSQDTLSADSCGRAEEDDEFDDFDPYLFIKNLPDLSAVVPTFRPMLLPKQTRSCPSITLVLDLDETLVHSTLEPCDNADFTFPVNFNLKEHTVYVRCRPHLKDFMERVASLFEIIIFTASQSIYAEQLLNVLDPRRKLFRHRVYRESCVYVEGNYLKDLSVLGRDLARVIIIDNSPQAFGFQIDNGIPIESWFDDRTDQELLTLLPFLESLVGVEDVRPFIAQKFNLREKVAAAASLT